MQFGDVNLADDGSDRDERGEAVLIKVVEFVKNGEQLGIPSVVRLRPVERCPHNGRDLLRVADLGSQMIVRERLVIDREAGGGFVERRLSADDHGEPVSQVVESLPKIVDAVANSNDDLWVRLHEGPIPERHFAFRPTLFEDRGPRIKFQEILDAGLGRVKMFECPR